MNLKNCISNIFIEKLKAKHFHIIIYLSQNNYLYHIKQNICNFYILVALAIFFFIF